MSENPRLSATTEFPLYNAENEHVVRSLVSINIPNILSNPAGAEPLGIALVLALDVSGSMRGQPLEVLAQTVEFAIATMKEEDYLGIVAFSHSARTLLPLVRMTPPNKTAARAVVQTLHAGGGTNIFDAVVASANMLAPTRTMTDVKASAILLLSDGRDSSSEPTASATAIAACIEHGVPCNSFGLGSDHDAHLLSDLSTKTRGIYTYVESNFHIPDAFAASLGILGSIVSKDFSLTVTAAPSTGIRVSTVSTSFDHNISSDACQCTVNLGTVYSGETKDILLSFILPALSTDVGEAGCVEQTVLQLKANYTPVGGSDALQIAGDDCAVTRYSSGSTALRERFEASRNAAESVVVAVHRFDALTAIKTATRQLSDNRHGDATCTLRRAIKQLEVSAFSNTAAVVGLLEDLRNMLKRLETRAADSHSTMYGVTQALSAQRMTSPMVRSARAYVTPAQTETVTLSRVAMAARKPTLVSVGDEVLQGRTSPGDDDTISCYAEVGAPKRARRSGPTHAFAPGVERALGHTPYSPMPPPLQVSSAALPPLAPAVRPTVTEMPNTSMPVLPEDDRRAAHQAASRLPDL